MGLPQARLLAWSYREPGLAVSKSLRTSIVGEANPLLLLLWDNKTTHALRAHMYRTGRRLELVRKAAHRENFCTIDDSVCVEPSTRFIENGSYKLRTSE